MQECWTGFCQTHPSILVDSRMRVWRDSNGAAYVLSSVQSDRAEDGWHVNATVQRIPDYQEPSIPGAGNISPEMMYGVLDGSLPELLMGCGLKPK